MIFSSVTEAKENSYKFSMLY